LIPRSRSLLFSLQGPTALMVCCFTKLTKTNLKIVCHLFDRVYWCFFHMRKIVMFNFPTNVTLTDISNTRYLHHETFAHAVVTKPIVYLIFCYKETFLRNIRYKHSTRSASILMTPRSVC